MIKECIKKLSFGEDLNFDLATSAMEDIMSGDATEAQIGAFVTALSVKGETPNEIAGMAEVMRSKSLQVKSDYPLVDTCGTGGDASNSFNISTASAFVVAGAGVKVAKHGNRAMSGSSGSADVLEALGANIDLGPKSVETCLNETGFGFMFAQRFHPSMKFAAAPRKEIGIRTVFNILGPLTNPAQAKFQLIGASHKTIAKKIIEVLKILKSKHSIVAYGEDGLDEISLSGGTHIWELKNGIITERSIKPSDLGLPFVDNAEIKINNPNESAKILEKVLSGQETPARFLVLANAGTALVAAEKAETFIDGVTIATKSIDSGSALKVLKSYIKLSNTLS
ncbi:MAG: anthranilate phosphoribosyltransferase [Chloroflexota bacterium]|jgi:anthranilate phosphoribosyltransferase|tara:strand:+ start:13481 stop:14494 length:1014 start_codon:yes stop_codon:yes gene_type:complete